MSADGVVGVLPRQEGLIEGGDLPVTLIDFIEFLRMGTLGPLHAAIELGGARRKDKEPYTTLLAGLLKGCLVFASRVDQGSSRTSLA